MITEAMIIIGSILIGYGLGKMAGEKKKFNEYIAQEIKNVDEKIHPVSLGAIKRPDARRLDQLRNPKKFEEENAMIEALKKIPDLNKRKVH